MASTLPKRTLGSVASLLAATLYQGNPDRNHKLWNIVSSERYIFHMQVLFTFRYIDDVLSLNNSRFGDFVDRIYSIEIEIKDTSDTNRSASYSVPHTNKGKSRREEEHSLYP
jgi:hypothetical protein